MRCMHDAHQHLRSHQALSSQPAGDNANTSPTRQQQKGNDIHVSQPIRHETR